VSLSLNVVRAGDEAAEAIPITPDAAAVTVPTSRDAPDVSEPMMKLTLSDLASFVAALVHMRHLLGLFVGNGTNSVRTIHAAAPLY
jgi:hypothetical protein